MTVWQDGRMAVACLPGSGAVHGLPEDLPGPAGQGLGLAVPGGWQEAGLGIWYAHYLYLFERKTIWLKTESNLKLENVRHQRSFLCLQLCE